MDPVERAYRLHKSTLKKKRRKEAEELKALQTKRASFGSAEFDGASSGSSCSSTSVTTTDPPSSQKQRLVYVFDNYSERLTFERIRTAISRDKCDGELVYALASVFDEIAFPPKILVPCTVCVRDLDPNYDTMASCKLPHYEIERLVKAQCGAKWTCYKCRKKSTGCDSNFSDNVEMESTEVGTSSADDGSGTTHSQKDRLLYVFGKISMKLAFERIKRATKELSLIHISSPRDATLSRMPSSA